MSVGYLAEVYESSEHLFSPDTNPIRSSLIVHRWKNSIREVADHMEDHLRDDVDQVVRAIEGKIYDGSKADNGIRALRSLIEEHSREDNKEAALSFLNIVEKLIHPSRTA